MTYPANYNPVAPAWRLAQYTFDEVPAGYCIEKATYFLTLKLTPGQSLFQQEVSIDKASDFIWDEWRFVIYNLSMLHRVFSNVQVRITDSTGRRISNDYVPVPESCGKLPIPLMLLRGTSIFIDASADFATDQLSVPFMLVFKGYKRFQQ